MNSVNNVDGPAKHSDHEGPNANPGEITTLFHRRIEFHLARKPFKGFSNDGKNGFKLETLNPSSSDYSNKSEPCKSFPGAVSGFGKVLDESNYGLDPELSFRITFRRIGAGLQNLGNTCFLNSVLQCLTYTEPLAAYLQSGRHKISCRTAGFCALCAIQKHVSRALEATGRILVPKDLVSNLRCISRNFRNARQEDAHEYMVNLLESMHKCCLPSGVSSESPSAYEKSLVHKIFGGRLRSQVKCLQCSFCSNKFDPFLDLSLEIVKADSLRMALSRFTETEQLDGGGRQYQCQQCKQKVRALKQLTVYKAPEVLTIHLKRFASHAPGVKIDKKIDFQTTLDLKPFVTGPHDGDLKYTLYGVLVHAGWSTHSGHYYCFVRTSSGMWYSLDDNQVVQVSEGKVLQQKAYMLFYVRDQRISVPKKAVDVLKRENVVINALGSQMCSNNKLGLKEANQDESIEKKLNSSISAAAAQGEAFDTNHFNRSKMKTNSALKVGGPSKNTSLPNGSLLVVTERLKYSDPCGPSECQSLKIDHSTETSLNVPATDSAYGSPIPNVTGGNCILKEGPFFQNTVTLHKSANVGCSNQVGLTASFEGNDNCNDLQGSANKNLDDGVPRSSTLSIVANTGKDKKSANGEHLDSIGLPECCCDTSSCSRAMTSEDGGLSEVAGISDSHCTDVNGGGKGESKQPETDLSCRKSQQNKLHVVKRRSLKCQATRLHLSSSMVFRAALVLRKKNRRRRRYSMAKADVKSVLSDIVPSTSKNSNIVDNSNFALSPRGGKHDLDRKVDTSMELIGNGEVPVGLIDEVSRKTLNQNCNLPANLVLQETSSAAATEKLSDLRESRCSEQLRSANVKTDAMNMAAVDTIVPRWDGLEPAPSDCLESGRADSVSIGYVGDEWDEEYDRGKRKKIREPKLTFGGRNPFQEIALKSSKTKKAKLEHYRSATQPFRI